MIKYSEKTLSIRKIDTGYLVNRTSSQLENDISAFNNWDEAVNFVKENPPTKEKVEEL